MRHWLRVSIDAAGGGGEEKKEEEEEEEEEREPHASFLSADAAATSCVPRRRSGVPRAAAPSALPRGPAPRPRGEWSAESSAPVVSATSESSMPRAARSPAVPSPVQYVTLASTTL